MDMIKMFNFNMTKSTAFILHLPLSQYHQKCLEYSNKYMKLNI